MSEREPTLAEVLAAIEQLRADLTERLEKLEAIASHTAEQLRRDVRTHGR